MNNFHGDCNWRDFPSQRCLFLPLEKCTINYVPLPSASSTSASKLKQLWIYHSLRCNGSCPQARYGEHRATGGKRKVDELSLCSDSARFFLLGSPSPLPEGTALNLENWLQISAAALLAWFPPLPGTNSVCVCV